MVKDIPFTRWSTQPRRGEELKSGDPISETVKFDVVA